MMRFYGDTYRNYRQQVSMIIPLPIGKGGKRKSQSLATDEKAKSLS